MSGTAFLVLNGDAPDACDLEGIDDAELIVCADGGCQPILDAGKRPHAVVGDMDGISEATLAKLAEGDVEVSRAPGRKDELDGQLALDRALAAQPERIVIIGGHGGRSPMFLATIGLLAAARRTVADVSLRGNGEEIRLLNEPDAEWRGPAAAGTVFSLVPWGGDAVVSISGASFGVERATLRLGDGRGVSNHVHDASNLCVVAHSGQVLVVVEGGEPRRSDP